MNTTIKGLVTLARTAAHLYQELRASEHHDVDTYQVWSDSMIDARRMKSRLCASWRSGETIRGTLPKHEALYSACRVPVPGDTRSIPEIAWNGARPQLYHHLPSKPLACIFSKVHGLNTTVKGTGREDDDEQLYHT